MSPLVSILIPAYNAAAWLGATLDSALAQSHPHIEVIVIDDGSTDATLALARDFAARHPARLRVAIQSNAGAAAARNHALRLAQGEFIQFLDADDLLAPDKIARQLAAPFAAPPLTLASGRWGRFTRDPASATWPEEPVYAAQSGLAYLQIHYETSSMMQPGAWLAPRALLDLAGPWDERLSLNDDGEYFARVALRAARILPVPEARCYYRSAATPSLSRRRDPAALRSLQLSVELTLAHLLAADNSPRTRAAAIRAWRSLAYELYPEAPAAARAALVSAAALGGPAEPLGGPSWLAPAARFLGWPLARRLQHFRNRLP